MFLWPLNWEDWLSLAQCSKSISNSLKLTIQKSPVLWKRWYVRTYSCRMEDRRCNSRRPAQMLLPSNAKDPVIWKNLHQDMCEKFDGAKYAGACERLSFKVMAPWKPYWSESHSHIKYDTKTLTASPLLKRIYFLHPDGDLFVISGITFWRDLISCKYLIRSDFSWDMKIEHIDKDGNLIMVLGTDEKWAFVIAKGFDWATSHSDYPTSLFSLDEVTPQNIFNSSNVKMLVSYHLHNLPGLFAELQRL